MRVIVKKPGFIRERVFISLMILKMSISVPTSIFHTSQKVGTFKIVFGNARNSMIIILFLFFCKYLG